MDKKYLVALDVGGTKADAVLFTDDGTVVNRLVESGGIPLDTGLEKCEEHYIDIVNRLIAPYCDSVEAFYASVATIEYYGTHMHDLFAKRLPARKIRIEGDGPCLISGMLGHNDGACMICGTGSSLYIRQGDEYHHTGGWGHLIDSCGSGYVLGRLAIQAALRAHDGRAEATILGDLIEKQCGVPIWDHLVEIYKGGRPYIASFAGTVFEARKLGDPVARRIFSSCAGELSDLVWVAYREIGKPFDLVFNGGIFSHFSEYEDAVRAGCPAEAHVIYSDVPPAYGCAVEAMYDIGLDCSAEFRENFMNTYSKR